MRIPPLASLSLAWWTHRKDPRELARAVAALSYEARWLRFKVLRSLRMRGRAIHPPRGWAYAALRGGKWRANLQLLRFFMRAIPRCSDGMREAYVRGTPSPWFDHPVVPGVLAATSKRILECMVIGDRDGMAVAMMRMASLLDDIQELGGRVSVRDYEGNARMRE